MKINEINIRDPFVLFENEKYYMYGTRGENFGQKTGGFDVYVSTDLENWSEPIECFDSDKYNMNINVNWAPEVHRYKDNYYMFATFTKPNGLRGTYILKADSPLGEFKPHSNGAVTPEEWECLDGTFYIDKNGKPFIIFCHEHTQIIDGTICYAELNDNLTEITGEVVTMFAGSEPFYIKEAPDDGHFVTDGPFMYRSKTDELFMLWSTFINHQYAECLVKFNDGELNMNFTHSAPLIDDDGGHGMIFKDDENIYLTFHTPNKSLCERPEFVKIKDNGNCLEIK
ncbi:MAG: family 43 glycosylhydrolase [Clostridia bacterium]|nr:family 43 glycosylhydrolase [Clostridia bacterium]